MFRLEVCLSFLKMSIALLNFILTLDKCSVHCKCLSKSTARYLTDWTGIRRFPCSLNLIEAYILKLVGENIISFIFWIFRHNLLTLSQTIDLIGLCSFALPKILNIYLTA